MTFAEKLSNVAETDPDYAKAIKRLRVASWIFGIAVTLALTVAIQAFWVNADQGDTINQYTNSACAKAYPVDGGSGDPKAVVECQELRIAIAKAEGIEGPCVLYQRATGFQGRNCPEFFIEP